MFRQHNQWFLIPITFLILLLPSMAMTQGFPKEEMSMPVGSVKTISGQSFVNRSGENIPTKNGDHLFKGDILTTSSNSSLGIIFRDDTILSMGSKSELHIDEFFFDPAKKKVGFMTTVSKGTAQFISGQIAKISPKDMVVKTPLSTIGIRGTRFLVKVD